VAPGAGGKTPPAGNLWGGCAGAGAANLRAKGAFLCGGKARPGRWPPPVTIHKRCHHKVFQKGVVNGYDSWYYVFAFDALVSPLEREESGRKVTLAAFFLYTAEDGQL